MKPLALVLAAVVVLPVVPAAHADPVSPLYTLVDTAVQRLQTAEPVAEFKWVNGGPITDGPRAQQVLDAVGADAAARNVDPSYVQTVFRNQIDATEAIQYTRFGQWKLDPLTAPRTAPDLAASRTQIDGYNRAMVEQIALQWGSLQAPTCADDLERAVTQVVQDRGLDPLHQRALDTATGSYCQTT
ncbi:chorismate mutase [Mycobacterium sp. ACS4331]|uniref:chorismate mutase n=1 Tax=Mycobacterium sp. ACS4331 TaxID=1834121 RepID=UPI00080018A8|nr:chorismate mutase [Mycobacterium sp. ACS4331]OBF29708.1 chorismate mutase [Mycobacterium sp. ACS4331]